MSNPTTLVVTLSDEDRNRPGMHCLPAMLSSFLAEQFALDTVGIRIEDAQGTMISETIPVTFDADELKRLGILKTIQLPTTWNSEDHASSDFAGLIGSEVDSSKKD